MYTTFTNKNIFKKYDYLKNYILVKNLMLYYSFKHINKSYYSVKIVKNIKYNFTFNIYHEDSLTISSNIR